MQFHENHHFKKHELYNGTLWLAGWCDHAPGKLNHMFADHEIPQMNGQFGLVWQGKDGWWLAQCDHLCSFPLWYSEDGEHVFSMWSDASSYDTKIDEIFYAQRDLIYGQMTVGNRTGRQDIKRVEPNWCVDRGTPVQYKHSLRMDYDGPDQSEWGNILKEAVRKNCKSGDVLFISGGRDSTTIANIAHNLGIGLKYIHVTRGKKNPDTESCKEFASNIGIDVHYLDPWEEGIDYDEGDFWHDSSYAPKRQCLLKLGKKFGITGELGASESGSKKINTILQMPDITIEQLTNIWITTLEARNESVASSEIHADYTRDHLEYKLYQKAYKEIVEFFEGDYRRCMGESTETHQRLKAAIMLHQQDHEAYRLHNYSQDLDLKWKHPFTDPYWFDIIMNAPLEAKKLHYHNREVYRIAAQDWEWFDTTAWNYGGPRGLKQ